jgi:hypothetical protein
VNIFIKGPMPKELPKDMQKVVEELSKTKSKTECLEKAYKVVVTRFHGSRVFLRIGTYFTSKIDTFWNKDKKTHCTNLNYILEVLLVKSGKFRRKDVKIKWTLSVLSPHQYLQIRIAKDQWINVDPFWGTYGTKLGNFNPDWKEIKEYFKE